MLSFLLKNFAMVWNIERLTRQLQEIGRAAGGRVLADDGIVVASRNGAEDLLVSGHGAINVV
jgi:hypothetical protein